MMVKTKKGEIIKDKPMLMQKFLYRTYIGRFILKLLNRVFISKLVGLYFSSKLSKIHIKKFINKNKIDMSLYEDVKYNSFNEFFTRKLKKLEIKKSNDLICPADSKLLVFKIDDKEIFKIKNSYYTLYDLLKDEKLATEFKNGYIMIYRLSVDDYHRYIYIDGGTHEENNFIKGVLHTVNPIAFDKYKVFHQNQRSYTVINGIKINKFIQMEVGALFVGKIKNHFEKHQFSQGDEKGMFLYGGSTVIVVLKEEDVVIEDIYLKNSLENIETKVKIGEKVGVINV